ncbi:hypothetical protein DFJ74DRAFT_220879 [Hyaloraphidium curvatum]|nr:hypothetical protein DFJ74DRAFT_220879 [Hyaloraphidium curvatum]
MVAAVFKWWPARSWLAVAGCLVTVYILQLLSAGPHVPVCPLPGSLPALRVVPARITSQAGQDGAIRSIFEAIGTSLEPFYVEFGFNALSFEGGSGANTYQLHLRGWRGLLMDGGNENATINLRKHMLSPENVCGLFRTYRVPQDLDYLSVDVDGLDLWILRALFRCGYRPRLVTIEYNSNLPASSCLTVAPDAKGAGVHMRNGTNHYTKVYGAGLASVNMLATSYGYGLAYVQNMLDAFLVRCDLLEAAGASPLPLQDLGQHGCIGQHHAIAPSEAGSLVDFCEWEEQGAEAGGRAGLERAREKAVREATSQGQAGSPCNVTIVDPMAEPG